MLKTGLNLFTTSPTSVEFAGVKTEKRENMRCCECCTSPLLGLCKPLCKYRKATYKEFIENIYKK